ncbi:MAG: glycosyltransferase, partial [Fusobacteria bacterium]|nr:glycosyltransferase [Fusobacteriota bacterium]
MNKISIITACYNSAKTITDTFNSILKQKYYNIEYIVIDGSSKDETVSIIQEYSSKFLNRGIEFKWISEKDSGIYDAMNKGIALATGEVIGIINSDDYYMENNILEDIMTRFYDETVDGIYGNIIFVDKEDNSRMVRIWKSSKYQKGSF